MPSVHLVHLSDLHCGSDYIVRAILEKRSPTNVFNPTSARKIGDQLAAIQPHIIVITGDFVNKPSRSNFQFAVRAVKDLCSRLTHFDIRERLLLVPGNHDIPWRDRTSSSHHRSRNYRRFVAELLTIPSWRVPLCYWRLFPQFRMCFLGLDSTRVITTNIADRLSIADGELGKDQIEWFRRTLTFLNTIVKEFDTYYKIVLLHHHPFPIPYAPPDRNLQLCDSGDLLKWLYELKVNVVLHGHLHFAHFTPYFDPYTPSRPIYVSGAGTATNGLKSEQCGQGNNFCWITFRDDGRIQDERIPVGD